MAIILKCVLLILLVSCCQASDARPDETIKPNHRHITVNDNVYCVDVRPGVQMKIHSRHNGNLNHRNHVHNRIFQKIKRKEETERILPSCSECRQIANYLTSHVRDNKTEFAIESAFRKACATFGTNLAECQNHSSEWSDSVLFVIRQACHYLKDCPDDEDNDTPIPPVVSKRNITSTEACFECRTVAGFIQSQLNSYTRQQKIDDFIREKVCPKFSVFEGRCREFINEYGVSVLQLIAMKVFDPKVLCEQELKLCPGLTSADDAVRYQLTFSSKVKTCNSCVRAVEILDKLLESGEVDQEISRLVGKACNHLQGPRRTRCKTIIEIYGPFMLQLIGRENNPRAVCRSIDLCTGNGVSHVLGGHKCTFGPTYWCHTPAHADSCHAKDYCSRHTTDQQDDD